MTSRRGEQFRHLAARVLAAGFADFEDAIQHACAIRARATHLLTRDLAGLRRSDVPVVSPEVCLSAQAEG